MIKNLTQGDNMKMLEEINESIKKNLPAQVGEVLIEQLNLLKEYKLKDIQKSEKIGELQESLVSCNNEKNKLQVKIYMHEEIDKREAAVKDRELKQDLRDLEVKFSELRRQDSIKLVELVFKSPTYQRVVSGNTPVPVEGSAGSNGSYSTPGAVIQSPFSTVETVTQN